ncbi:unnamed protein product [Spirodela intermedia]|uniref:Uncharacterized protein n=2 Tax=Spirodela intermedia TaxID=51605 RepID=A0A7I8JDY9_SPIIN|nr:unnamed protein product [Spirodela intermedia]CAA6667965.1 unnamed protein product [Spirodela intermedia]CAA7404789.1 unnamed protein product [Spirodela intermedia]
MDREKDQTLIDSRVTVSSFCRFKMKNLHKNHISCLFKDGISTPCNSGYIKWYQSQGLF